MISAPARSRSFSMKTELWLYLLVVCGVAECFVETSVDLGQNVTLQCEVCVRNVYWFLMKPSLPPVYILETFSSRSLNPRYSNVTFEKTFSVQYNSSLFIHNISTNELGVYYCMQTHTGLPPNISTGIRLHIQNKSADNQSSSKEPWLWLILIIFVVENCALAFLVTVCYCRRSHTPAPDPDLRQSIYDSGLVYTDVQLTPTYSSARTSNANSIYASVKPRTRGPE